MPLVLKPSIGDFSRSELEEHLTGIRMRRMAIAFDYQAGQQLELEKSKSRVERKYGEGVTSLGRELATLDRALEKVEKRMDALTALKQEHGLLADLINSQTIVSEG